MNLPILIDMAAALALTALLAESYGAVRRRLVGDRFAPVVLGVLFGIMAAVHMLNPVEAIDGLIIDLRNIPIALAGAFLGWRGLIPCLLIAAAVRIGIGGVGTVAGLWAMSFAGLAGMIWARKMASFPKRNFSMLLLLALAMSSHLLGALALPRDMAVWFFTSAAGPILLMNLVTVPLFGALLEREHQRILKEESQASQMTRDPNTGLLTGHALVREVTNAFAAHPLGAFAGVLIAAPHESGWRTLFSGSSNTGMSEIDARLFSDHLNHWALAGRTADGHILIPLSKQELETVHRVRASVRDALVESQLGGRSHLIWDVSETATPDPAEFLQLVEHAALVGRTHWRGHAPALRFAAAARGEKSRVRRSRIFNPDEHDALFAKANFLIERGRS